MSDFPINKLTEQIYNSINQKPEVFWESDIHKTVYAESKKLSPSQHMVVSERTALRILKNINSVIVANIKPANRRKT